MFLLNSRLGLLTATCGPASARGGAKPEAFLLPKLRNHFAEFLSEESLVHLEVLTLTYLCRCAVRALSAFAAEGFLAGGVAQVALTDVAASTPPLLDRAVFESRSTRTRRDGPCPIGPLALSSRVAPAAQARTQRGRNMNRLSIAYAFRPRLRPA